MKRLLALLIVLLTFASCEEYYLFLESIKQEDKYKLIYNIPNSNWDSIILMSDDDAFCMNVDDSLQKELLAIINNNTDFRIKFDELTRPTIFAVDNLSIDIVYTEESIQFMYEIDGESKIETYPLPDLIQTRSSAVDALVFTGEVVKSQIVDYAIDVIDGILESALGTPILGAFDDFVDMVDTLRDLDNLSDAVELVDYLESEIDIIKFIDLIKKRPTYEEDDSTTYIVGLTAGNAQVIDNRAKLELLVTIIGKSKGGNLDFEYGVCYSKISPIPMYTDATVGTRFIGMTGQTYIEITDPHTFETVELEGGKFYYRGYFKDNDTGNVIYSDNVKSFTIETSFCNGANHPHAVDLGLSVKWACCNVGANSPEEYGDYFAWGETSPKSSYTLENYQHWVDDDEDGVCDLGESTINTNISGTQYDAATANWGGSWRMPTFDEMRELVYCTWEKSMLNEVKGYLVTGPNGNSIFLPAAGWRFKSSSYGVGSYGEYWSSAPGSYDWSAYYLEFDSVNHGWDWDSHHYGRPVRPVQNK